MLTQTIKIKDQTHANKPSITQITTLIEKIKTKQTIIQTLFFSEFQKQFLDYAC